MSAFTDIWIGSTEPPVARKGNTAWKSVTGNILVSIPAGGSPFYKQHTDERYSLIIIGQLYEQVSEPELLNRCVQYIQHPSSGYEDVAGHYILFLRDNIIEQTHVFTNRLGSYHAYWSADGIISTRYLPLAQVKQNKNLDWQGISGFMAMGYFPADKTYLEDIRTFEPASYYCFNSELKPERNTRYWNWQYTPADASGEYYNAQLHNILWSSLGHATAEKNVCIPISGGLDSRLLAGELTNNKLVYKSINALSYGYTATSPEIKIGVEVARQAGFPIHTYNVPDYLFGQLDDISEAVDLFQYVDGTRQASAVDWLRDNVDVVVGGHWGDVWMDSANVQHSDLQQMYENKIVKKGSDWLLKNICAPHVNGLEWNTEYFNSFMKRYSYIDDAAFRMKIYKTDQWSFRWTAASLRMYQAGAFPVLPFYDRRIVDLFSTVPQPMLRQRALQVEYIKHYYPALAEVTWQEYDANLYNYKGFNNRHIAYRVAGKIKRAVAAQPLIQRNWEVFYLHEKGRKNLEAVLLNNSGLQEFVSNSAVAGLLEDFYKHPTAANGYTVSMLLTFSLFVNRVLS